MPENQIKLNVIKPRKKDIFDRIKLSEAEIQLLRLKKEIPGMIEKAVSEAISQIKIPESVKETVREIRVEGPKPKEYDEPINQLKKVIEEQKKTIEKLRSQVEDVPMPGGPGVIGIPPPEAASENQILTVVKGKAQWAAVQGSGGGSLAGYTVNNGNELKTFDVTDTSLNEIARVLGSVIADLS